LGGISVEIGVVLGGGDAGTEEGEGEQGGERLAGVWFQFHEDNEVGEKVAGGEPALRKGNVQKRPAILGGSV
jgi:hypothetical protein